MRTWSVCLTAGTLASLLAGASACRATSAPAATPVHLTIGYADPRTTGSGLATVVSLLDDERLLRPLRDGQFEAGLAERWEQSPDGLVWRFVLRPRLTFHDGTPVNASVVAATVNGLARTKGSRPGFRDVETAEASGPLDLVIKLRRPSRLLLDALALESFRSPGKNPAGAGPFAMISKPVAETDQGAILTAFPGYFRGRPAIDQVEVKLFKTPRTAWSAMMRGEVDVVYETTPDVLGFIQESSETQVKSFLRPYVFTLGFNLRHPVLGQRPVRVALNQAVNRDEIIKTVFSGRGTPATSMLWPQHWAYDSQVPAFRYAPAEAGRILDANGLRVKPTPDRRMPSRFSFTCLVSQSDARYERVALVLQKQLIDVGIDMQLEPVPLDQIGKRVQAGHYDAFLLDMASPTLDWTFMFWHSPENGEQPMIDSGYHGADAVLDRVRASRNDVELRGALNELQRLMHEDPPAVFLCWSETTRAISARFRVPIVPNRDVMATIWQWRLAPGASPGAVATPSASPPSTP
jgi:peptide/nickel transport system substrate-binding protein